MVVITTTENDGICLVGVKGEIDASSSLDLDNALSSAIEKHQHLLIDLSALTYISSAGLGVFVSHLDETKESNVHMVLFGLSPEVYEIFNLLGLPSLIPIVATEEEARKAIQ